MSTDTADRLPLRFWIIAAIAFINAVSFTSIIPLLYPYAKTFGLSDFTASLLTTAYAVSQFLATPILGKWSDHWGRKPLLVLSLLGTVLANVLSGLASTAWLLFLARILDGITGGNNSIATAVISDTTTAEQRPRAFGLFDAAFRLGFVTGPALSYLAQTVPPLPGVSSLGMSFLAAAAIALAATILTAIALPETLAEKRPIRLEWSDFGFIRIATSFQLPKLGRLFQLTFFSGFTFTIFTFAFQPFFLNVLGQDARSLTILFILVGVVGVITQIVAVGPTTDRFNLANILFVALLSRALVFILIPFFPSLTPYVLLISALAITNAFPLPLINALLSTNSDRTQQGEVLGINASYLSVSNAIGPAFAGWLVGFSYGLPFWIAGGLTILTAVFALQLKSTVQCDPAN